MENIVLENDRVLIRSLQESDFDHLLPFSLNEPELWKYSLIPANGEANLRHYLELALEKQRAGTVLPFIIFDKLQQSYAGSSRFYEINQLQKTMLLGYTWYGKAFQGTGLNKNCKLLLLTYAFETMEMARVELRADNENKRSKAAMRSMGATEEGVLRSESFKTDGTRRDSVIFSILADEWRDHIKDQLTDKVYQLNNH